MARKIGLPVCWFAFGKTLETNDQVTTTVFLTLNISYCCCFHGFNRRIDTRKRFFFFLILILFKK